MTAGVGSRSATGETVGPSFVGSCSVVVTGISSRVAARTSRSAFARTVVASAMAGINRSCRSTTSRVEVSAVSRGTRTDPRLQGMRSGRVEDYVERFATFLADEVEPLEAELATRDVGSPFNPRLDEAGRMHPAVWEARREAQRRSAAAGLYSPHVPSGGGFSRAEMQDVEEFVYRRSGLGLGLAALAWTEGPNAAIEHCSPAAREHWLEPLLRAEITAAFANTEMSVGTDVLAMETHAVRDGDDWILNGDKAWITNAHFADVIQVTAVTEPGAGTSQPLDVPRGRPRRRRHARPGHPDDARRRPHRRAPLRGRAHPGRGRGRGSRATGSRWP